MQINDKTSPAEESGTSKATESDSKPNGLIKSLLGSVLEGKDAVIVKADSSAQDQEEKVNEQDDKAAPENPDK